MTFEQELSVGKPNSLGNTEKVVRKVLKDPVLLADLFATLKSKDEWVRMRTGDALEKVFRDQPELARKYMRNIFAMSKFDQPSLQWHSAQILSEIPLTPVQKEKALDILKRYLKTSTDWIVLNVTMDILFNLAKDDVSVQKWLKPELKRLSNDSRDSVAKRAKKLLAA